MANNIFALLINEDGTCGASLHTSAEDAREYLKAYALMYYDFDVSGLTDPSEIDKAIAQKLATDNTSFVVQQHDQPDPLAESAHELLAALEKARLWVGQYNGMQGHDAASRAMCAVIDTAIENAKARAA